MSDDKNALIYLADVRTENAKLRKERDYLLMNSNPTACELRRVRTAWRKDRDENAKLRELVRDILRNMHGCTYHHNCGSCDFDECTYEVRARELGIEEEQ